MYLDSSFAKPVSSFQRPVPLVLIDPDAEPLICVKFNEAWLAYIIGSLKQLLLQTTWKTSDPDELNNAQGRAFNLIELFSSALTCAREEALRDPGLSLEDTLSQQIRISPDDSCIIQMWCIDHWEDWYNPRECIATGAGQQTAGAAGQPGPSETRSYCFSIEARTPALYPVAVNTGDTISVDQVEGAWTDGLSGLLSTWRCPDGQTYTLGACSGGTITDGADLMPTQPHMGLIAWIDAEMFYIGTGATFLVPAGITDAQLLFMPNNSDPTGASGSVSACVTIDTAAAAPLNVSYDTGSGPTQVTNGGVYVFTSDSSGNPGIDVTFSAPVKITIQSSTLDHPVCATTCAYYTYYNPPGTQIVQYSYPPTHPTDVPAQTNVSQWTVNSGGGGPTYTITAKIEF